MEDEYIEVNEISETEEGRSEEVLEEYGTAGEITDSSSNSSLDTEPSQLSDSAIAEALRSFIENYSSDSSEASASDLDEEGEASSDSSALESSEIDYSSILSSLYEIAEDNSTTASSILNYMEVQEQNNQLDSSIDDISLSNTLLICIMAVLMFGCCILYGRRIF